MKTLEKFLEFNGKRISILLADGSWWVAVKPICEALGVNYDRQQKNIKDDPILSQLYAKQHTVGADGKLREMICLPEKFVYGWLFSVRSSSEELLAYKRVCYEVLYDHFHVTMTKRAETLNYRRQLNQEQKELEESLLENEDFLRLQELKTQRKSIGTKLANMDKDLIDRQGSFDF